MTMEEGLKFDREDVTDYQCYVMDINDLSTVCV